MTTYTTWLHGPAAIVYGIGFSENGDHHVLHAQVKYGKIRRTTDKDDFFAIDGVPFDLIETGTYANGLIAAQARAFYDGATTWMQDAVKGIPNRVRLTLSITHTRVDSSATGLTACFRAQGEHLPGGAITADTIEGFRQALLDATA